MFWLASRKTTEFAPEEAVTPVPPYAAAIVEPCQVPEATVPSALELPLASKLIDFPAGYVTKTLLEPADNVIGEVFPFELDRIVVRARVGPVVEYVPIPTSQAFPSTMV
jgi:hypothetical protein